MIEKELDIPTADGAMNTFVVYPDEGSPHPVVLFYMDAPGKREELHDMARRLASVGYYVVLPNLYYRRTRDFQMTERSEAMMATMFGHMASLDARTTAVDTATDAPDSPHRMVDRIRCESYFACAEIDRWAPPADIQKLQGALEAAGRPHRIEWYAAVEHGFVFPQRDSIYNRAAAERHWERLFNLFDRTLRA